LRPENSQPLDPWTNRAFYNSIKAKATTDLIDYARNPAYYF